MYRFEKYHNGHTMPTDWDGRGQPTAWRTEPPTIWMALRYTIDTGAVKLMRFLDKESRDNWVNQQKRKNDEGL